ncbi:MAG: DUF362 domain-containing protein [Proteobacteria bacterium]|nr:DUF362 domain-containing protein [Pseudomonadota bacterium]
MRKITRRKFMKKAAVMGAAITAFPAIFIPKARAFWAQRTVVHPNVDNLRVVGATDPSMTRAVEPAVHWARQEELVVPKAVWENMDRLACGLSETRNPEEAWRNIFVKPPRKPWSETVVAVKTNHISRQHTRSAVMSRICHALTDLVGVKPSNIHIYDACHGDDMARETPFQGLPEGVRIEGTWGGMRAPTALPKPWEEGDGTRCLDHLVNGTVDILVNISMCKGHSSSFGGFTMTMKNHFGTFSPRFGHWGQGHDYLLAINQTPEILGTMDRRSGRVLYPRQQLCIVDALWASKHGPSGNPSHQPNFLAMGVMSPVVDYQVATRFRDERMGWRPNLGATRRMLEAFGYSESDLPSGGKIIEV